MIRRSLVALLLIGSGVVAGALMTGRPRSAHELTLAPSPAVAQRAPAAAGSLSPDFSQVAAHTINSVTNISSRQMVRTESPFGEDPFFHHFFGGGDDFFGWREAPSLGSGVVVSPDGYILTNAHVIGERVRDVRITLADRREREARIVGLDEWTDIALLKIDARGLPVIPWGDSSTLRVAEWVLAIGNPFQLNQTVTLGIISAVGRTNLGIAEYENFIQTDAAINPGNSGGALINARGELVGINTAIFSRSGGYQGIGFAVPSNVARRVMEDLMRYGEVRRGSLGYLELTTLTRELAEEVGLREARGALVTRMRRDSEAFRAGLKPGDVIVRFDREPVEDASHFLRLLSDAPVGGTVTLAIIRDGREQQVRVQVQQTPSRRPI